MGAISMTLHILDTNVLVRFLVGDNPVQQKQAARWFKEAEHGKYVIVLTPLVVAETSFVLESFYKLKRADIANALEVIVSERWIKVEERETLQHIWDDYRDGLHFVDSYLCAWAKIVHGSVLTFDKKITRKEKTG